LASFVALVQNEVLKILRKKRFYVVLLILALLVPLFVYAQMRQVQSFVRQSGTTDWRVEVQQRIADYQRALTSARIPEEWKKWRRIQIQKLEYYLEHDVNPNALSGLQFTRRFLENAVSLFIPLMVMVVSADLVSGEHTAGTIKLLLSRPVRRWKILTSKLVALVLFASLTTAAAAVISYAIAGAVFGYGGWTMPEFVGFRVVGTEVDVSAVRVVPLWQYVWMECGLVWFVALSVGCLSFALSVLIRSTAAGMGVMLALLISGSILSSMAESWKTAKYFFMVNLQLTDYLAGDPPPIEGMSLPFSLAVLGATAAAGLVVAYAVFTRKDVLN